MNRVSGARMGLRARAKCSFGLCLPPRPMQRSPDIARQIQSPPVLLPTPAYLAASGVFGGAFSLPDRTVPQKDKIEKQLDFLF